jgi:hypothetical protein
MIEVIYTDSPPGTRVFCFPLNQSLANWLTGRIELIEGSGVDAGRWIGTLPINNWAVFEGNMQPSNFSERVGSYIFQEESTPEVPAPSSLAEQLQQINDLLGPKRIKTPNMETEDHDLKDLLEVQRTTTVVRPHFSNFAFTKAIPKGGCSCEDSVSQSRCNRNY